MDYPNQIYLKNIHKSVLTQEFCKGNNPHKMRVCEEISVNNQIFYDNELAEGLF